MPAAVVPLHILTYLKLKNVSFGPAATSVQLSATEARAETLLGRTLSREERIAVSRAHEICGTAGATGFSQGCRILKMLACRRTLSRVDCRRLGDAKIVGDFSPAGEVDAQFERLATVDAWLSSAQVSSALAQRDLATMRSTFDSALNELEAGQSVNRALKNLESVRDRFERGVGAYSPENLFVRRIQPGVDTGLRAPGVTSVIMNPAVTRFLQENNNIAPSVIAAIKKGFVSAERESGLKRLANIDQDFVEVKMTDSAAGSYRILGCLKSGVIRLLSVYHKTGAGALSPGDYRSFCR